jgi:RNA polymerase sigma factor (sigma-70 family)
VKHEGIENGNGYVQAVRRLRTLFAEGAVGTLSDGQLLGRFAARRGEEAEGPFAALVERHGPMVLRACRAILRDEHEAQDAFQATFLVLARKARSLWVRDSIAPWLHQVACRTAHAARSAAGRRRALERRMAEMAQMADGGWQMPDDDDLGPALHEEVDRLPDRYRRPLVLCYLEGLTHEQAARQLDWHVGTVRSRLARGRERLKGRLVRRGLAPGLTLGLAADSARAEVSNVLLETTVRAATRFATGHATAAGLVSAPAVALSEGVLRTMVLSKLKLLAAGLVAAGLLATGTAAVARRDGDDPKSPSTKAPEAAPKEDGAKPTPPEYQAHLDQLSRDESNLVKLQMERDRASAEIEKQREDIKVAEANMETLRQQIRTTQQKIREMKLYLTGKDLDPAEIRATQQKFRELKTPADRPGGNKAPEAEARRDTSKSVEQQLREARDLISALEEQLRMTKLRQPDGRRDESSRFPAPADRPDANKAGPRAAADRPDADKNNPRADRDRPNAAADRAGTGDTKGQGGARREPRYYQQLQPTLYFAASATGDKAAVYNIETRKAKSVRLAEPKEARLQVVPIIAPNMVSLRLNGPKIARLAVFTFPDFEWHAHDLAEPFEGEVSPMAGMRVVAYIVGRRVYAFSAATKTWDVLDVPPGAPLTPRVQADSVVLEFDGQLHEFQATSGRWGVHPSVQTILDGILDDDEAGPKG